MSSAAAADHGAAASGSGPAKRSEAEAPRGGVRSLSPGLHIPLGTPAPSSPLIGREAQVADVRGLLIDPGVRLVTLTGPGGVGKTRLAIQAGQESASAFPDGVWFVPLAAIADSGLVVTSIVQALGLREAGEARLVERLITFLRYKRLLLVLDNFEQVVEAATVVSQLIAPCPRLAVLITSRIRTRIYGERELEVPPLALTEPSEQATEPAVATAASVQLFVARARAVKPDFALTPDNAAIVAAICRRLEGLPLAIELAAARIATLSPAALLARLEQRLPMLTSDLAELPPRQRTMRDAIAWSYDLLHLAEQAMFRQLAVFVDGFSLEAAEEVVTTTGAPDSDVFAGIAALADSSLLRLRLGPNDEPRFGLLETVREFARQELEASDDARGARDRHAACMLALVARAEDHLIGPERRDWHILLRLELDNIRAALSWLAATGDDDAVLRLAGVLWRFWYANGDHTEGRTWLRSALAVGGDPSRPDWIKALTGAALLEHCGGHDDFATEQGETALALARSTDDSGAMAVALYVLGKIVADTGHYELAGARFGEALGLFRSRGDLVWSGLTLGQLGCVAYGQNQIRSAQALLAEALALQRASKHRYGAAVSLLYLGHLAQTAGDPVSAAARYNESLVLWWEEGFLPGLVEALSGVASVAVMQGRSVRAAKLFGAAETMREAIGIPAWLPERALYDRAVTTLKRALRKDALAVAWAAGRAMPAAEAVALALAGQPGATGMTPATQGLTPRELEVLHLLSEGVPDKEIASRLAISPRTASKHVATILAKLGVENRAAAVVAALRANVIP